MTDPKRLLDEGADSFERSLLSAHSADGRSEELLRKTLVGLGAAAALGTTSSTATAAGAGGVLGSAATKIAAGATGLGLVGVMKWVGAGTAVCSLVVAAAWMGSGAAVSTQTAMAPAQSKPLAVSAAATTPQRAETSVPIPQAPEPILVASAVPVQARATGVVATTVPTSTPSASASVEVSPVAPAASSLSSEIAALDGVRRSIASRNGAEALRQLDAYQRGFPQAKLGLEATVLRIEALVVSGDRATAQALAERFLKSPSSAPHATRVRSLVGMTNP